MRSPYAHTSNLLLVAVVYDTCIDLYILMDTFRLWTKGPLKVNYQVCFITSCLGF